MGIILNQSANGERWQPMRPLKEYYSPMPTEIKQLRISYNLTQSEASDIVCVTPTTWARWETNRCAMPAGLWKLFNNEVNKTNSVIPNIKDVDEMKSIVNDWTEHNPYD